MSEKQYVYIIKSIKDNSVYVGCTSDLKKRVREHNLGLDKYSRTKMPWNLVWYSMFVSKEKAYRFEKYLKTGSGIAFRKKRILP